MLNILSIDIDYAYSPTIETYDYYVEGSRISLAEQRKIFHELNLPSPKVNQTKLDLLRHVVMRCVAPDTPVHIITNHHHILGVLPKDSEIRIINFDHHHDILYLGWHDRSKIDEGNWVSFLGDHKVVDFTWIRNKGSENRMDTLELGFDWHEVYEPSIEEMPRFDLVIGCISPHWTGEDGKKHLDYVLGR